MAIWKPFNNQGFYFNFTANRIAARTSQARQQALAAEAILKQKMSPAQYQKFIDSYQGKTA